jgi:succinate dehydrogenase / fumarate reductase cytochrome b subunit
MSHETAPSPPLAFYNRHHFLLRRLHSLSGIVPIGAFLLFHLTTNGSIAWGQALSPGSHGGVQTFQHEVDFIHRLPALVLMEIFVLWLPIAFHAILGIVFAVQGRPNVAHYGYQANWRYTLQRLTGYLGVLYIFVHVSSTRWGWDYWGVLPAFDGEHAASSTAAHLTTGPLGAIVPLFYLVSVLALVFHFANGMWTAAITWGMTVSVAAQRRWGWVCTAVGLGLAAMGVAAVVGFWTLDIDDARRIEDAMRGEHVMSVAEIEP